MKCERHCQCAEFCVKNGDHVIGLKSAQACKCDINFKKMVRVQKRIFDGNAWIPFRSEDTTLFHSSFSWLVLRCSRWKACVLWSEEMAIAGIQNNSPVHRFKHLFHHNHTFKSQNVVRAHSEERVQHATPFSEMLPRFTRGSEHNLQKQQAKANSSSFNSLFCPCKLSQFVAFCKGIHDQTVANAEWFTTIHLAASQVTSPMCVTLHFNDKCTCTECQAALVCFFSKDILGFFSWFSGASETLQWLNWISSITWCSSGCTIHHISVKISAFVHQSQNLSKPNNCHHHHWKHFSTHAHGGAIFPLVLSPASHFPFCWSKGYQKPASLSHHKHPKVKMFPCQTKSHQQWFGVFFHVSCLLEPAYVIKWTLAVANVGS